MIERAMFVSKSSPTYVKLQDAYVAEKGTTVGSWKQIGYSMMSSSNFYYCGENTNACSTEDAKGYGNTTPITTETYTAYWAATNKATLNDCQKNSVWSLTTAQNGSAGGLIVYTAAISDANNCEDLTPNFMKLNTATN